MSEDWVSKIREDFPALRQRRYGKPPVYLDNACTTLVPEPVIAAVLKYYREYPGCGGERGRYWFAEEVAGRIDGDPDKGIKGSRRIVADFINAASPQEIIFTLNTSHAINMVALGLDFKPGDAVVLGDREHNSNLIPWLRLQKKGIVNVAQVFSGEDDRFDLTSLREKLVGGNVKLVSLAWTSNLTGATIPAREVISLAHEYGARVLLDGAQTLPHRTVDVRELDVDFLAFSIHKLCGPRGVGVLYSKGSVTGRAEHEEDDPAGVIEPVILGGGTVADTTYVSYNLLEPPQRFEAGIQDYPGQIAAGEAIDYLRGIGLERIGARERELNEYLTGRLLDRYGNTEWFRIVGPAEASERGGILTFEVRRPNAVGIAEELNEKSNIMIRDGGFCVHSYLNKKFGPGWTRPRLPAEHRMTYRVSLYFYNTFEECEIFAQTLHNIFIERSYV